jgi:hypothetical protein
MDAQRQPVPHVGVDFDFHALICVVEQWGLRGRDAFITACTLRGAGIDAGRAVKLFRDGERGVQ